MNTMIDLCLGAVFVAFYAAGRFNTPATNRSSTTAMRYFAGLSCYCIVGLSGYIAIVRFPQLLVFLMQGDDTVVQPWARQLSSPLLAALLLTVLLPRLPLLSELDNWIRKHLQDLAAIPFEVRRLSAELRKDKLLVSDELQTDIVRKLEKRGINRKNICFEPEETPGYGFTRVAVLLTRLGDWESDRRMSGYLGAFPRELDQLWKAFDQLFPKAKICFRLQNDVANSLTTRTQEAMVRYQEDFAEQLAQLHGSVLDFISRGVLHAEITDATRQQRLRQMGFQGVWRRTAFTWNQATFLFGVLLLVLVASMLAFSNSSGATFGTRLLRTVVTAITYCIAAACAVLPKERWAFARHAAGQIRPVAFYIVSGLIAAVLGLAFKFAFNCLLMGSINGAVQRFLITYPWFLTTFGTAVMLGILIDNPELSRLSRLQQRIFEAVAQGAVMAVLAYIAWLWILERIAYAGPLVTDAHAPDLLRMMVTAGSIGLVLGFWIPTWFRQTRAHPAEIEPARNIVTYQNRETRLRSA